MLRRPFLLLVAGAWLAGCSLPAFGGPVPEPTPTSAPTTIPRPTGTPSGTPTGTPTPAVDITGEPPAMVEPPAATLTVDGQAQLAGIGTYCWNSGEAGASLGMCVDKIGVPTPRDPLQVNAVPFTAHFSFPLEDPPTGASLTLIPVSAEGEMTVESTSDWRWWQFGDGETVELAPGVETEVELSPQPGLYALAVFTAWEGRGDVVYGFLVQVGEAETGGVAVTMPATCQPHDNLSPYVDPGGRYCLLFSSYFRIGDVTLDRANFQGMPLDQSLEPVFAALSVSAVGPAGERTLAQVVDDHVAENGQGLPITRSALALAGAAAELVEGLPGLAPHWQIFLIHAGTVVQFWVFPKGHDFAQAAPEVDAVWNAVSASLTFFE